MNNKDKGKAPLDCAEGRVARGRFISNSPAEAYSSVNNSGSKRKASSLLEEILTDLPKSMGASDAAVFTPSYDFGRNILAEKSSSQLYPNMDWSMIKDHAQVLKGWEDMKLKKKCSTVLWADSLAKAAVEATSFARELIQTQEMSEAKIEETQQRIIEIENQLELAKHPIKKLTVMEKEYSQIFESMNQRFQSINSQVAQLKEYSAEVVQHYTLALISYMKNLEDIQTSNPQIKHVTTENQEVRRPVLTKGLNLAVQAARAANPNFTLNTDFLSSSSRAASESGETDRIP